VLRNAAEAGQADGAPDGGSASTGDPWQWQLASVQRIRLPAQLPFRPGTQDDHLAGLRGIPVRCWL